MGSPTFSQDEFSSNVYRWREELEGRILVTIFSQVFPLGNGSNYKLRKMMEEDDEYGNVDVDAQNLRKIFSNDKIFPVPVDVEYKPRLSSEGLMTYLRSIKEEKYDCFVFAFLTYTQPENTITGFSDERLHFDHITLEGGLVSLAAILEEVKNINVAKGKPKVFLIQADDLSFLEEKKVGKGPTFVPAVIEKKIPQDADRLIIRSTIPQQIANFDPKTKEKKNPSFLVQAFVEAVHENAGRGDDLLTLTTYINGKVAHMINESEHFRSKDMTVPLTTSTFTKLLILQ